MRLEFGIKSRKATPALDLKNRPEDSKIRSGDNINRSEEPEHKDPKKQITTEIDQQATPLSTLFSKSQLQMIEKAFRAAHTQDDYAEYPVARFR